MNTILMMYIALPSCELAEKIAVILLERRLIAFSQIIQSEENLLLCKTLPAKEAQVRAVIQEFLPQRNSEILSFGLQTQEKFCSWVAQGITAS